MDFMRKKKDKEIQTDEICGLAYFYLPDLDHILFYYGLEFLAF
jgi:hypothetical protein